MNTLRNLRYWSLIVGLLSAIYSPWASIPMLLSTVLFLWVEKITYQDMNMDLKKQLDEAQDWEKMKQSSKGLGDGNGNENVTTYQSQDDINQRDMRQNYS